MIAARTTLPQTPDGSMRGRMTVDRARLAERPDSPTMPPTPARAHDG